MWSLERVEVRNPAVVFSGDHRAIENDITFVSKIAKTEAAIAVVEKYFTSGTVAKLLIDGFHCQSGLRLA